MTHPTKSVILTHRKLIFKTNSTPANVLTKCPIKVNTTGYKPGLYRQSHCMRLMERTRPWWRLPKPFATKMQQPPSMKDQHSLLYEIWGWRQQSKLRQHQQQLWWSTVESRQGWATETEKIHEFTNYEVGVSQLGDRKCTSFLTILNCPQWSSIFYNISCLLVSTTH